ncbi:HAMP domain-containing sensor histidine kinase [Burkholderia sp. RF4-BP95]|uniref:sensor histidine kinase n=1 Tax=Burkholderia sp. RF4-BP95 TaxID=1637845 RepID=UPI0015CFFAB7|nr:HAMP domain-containing sensor histidine kinase [Burkholderia sp. RF4-BP95]
MLITLSASLIAIAQAWNILSDKYSSVDLLATYRRALVVTEMVSRERGPVNSVLGAAPHRRDHAAHALVEARQRTDAAISALVTALPANDLDRSTVIELDTRLAVARRRVDALTALPASMRRAPEMSDALRQMFGLVDILQPMLSRMQTPLLMRVPEISYQIAGARLLTELREYAGRLGSDLAPAVVHDAPLTQRQEAAMERDVGRILELYDLLKMHATDGTTDPELEAGMDALRHAYLDRAWKLAARIRDASRAGEPYPMTMEEFTNEYVPAMNPIVALRDTELQLAAQRIDASIDHARLSLGWVTGFSVLAFALEIVLIRTFRRKVIEPVEEVSAAFGPTAGGARGENDDIVRLRNGPQRLRASEAENILLERERQDALNFISHDIRAPIAAIITMTEGSGHGVESSIASSMNVRRYIARQARHALSLVDEYLQFARLQSRIESHEFQPVNIVDVLTEVVDDSWACARCRDVKVLFDSPVADAWVSGARLMVFRIFSNLIHNAIKFSFTGGDVHVTLGGRDDYWTVSVRDWGTGIASDDLSKLFRPFYRSPAASEASVAGTGLGLAYVRIAVTQLGGTVKVTSSLDVGSEFLVTLPASDAAECASRVA